MNLNILAKSRIEARNPHLWAVLVLFSIVAFFYHYFGAMSPLDRPYHVSEFFVLELRNRMHGSLFFLPFLYATFTLRLSGALIIWFLSVATILPLILRYPFSTTNLILVNMLYAALPMLVVLFIVFEIRWREKERRMMREKEAERQEYLKQLLRAQEEERQHISQELHDDALQRIMAIVHRTQTILADNARNDISRTSEEIFTWLRNSMIEVADDLRRLSLDLRPSVLDEMGLIPALRWLVDRMNGESGVATRLMVTGEVRELSAENEVNIFRLVQEALNNIRQHSKSATAEVKLEFNWNCIKIHIQDQGVGFEVPHSLSKYSQQGKLGIAGMVQRVKLLNGKLSISSKLGEGTIVSLYLQC